MYKITGVTQKTQFFNTYIYIYIYILNKLFWTKTDLNIYMIEPK